MAEALPRATPFRDFAARAHRDMQTRGAEHESFFRGMLGDVEEPTAPFRASEVKGDGATAWLAVDAVLARRLRAQARAMGVASPPACFMSPGDWSWPRRPAAKTRYSEPFYSDAWRAEKAPTGQSACSSTRCRYACGLVRLGAARAFGRPIRSWRTCWIMSTRPCPGTAQQRSASTGSAVHRAAELSAERLERVVNNYKAVGDERAWEGITSSWRR